MNDLIVCLIFVLGYARLSYVEFYHTGQEGYPDDFDPRYSLAFLSVGDVSDIKPSNVTGCSFNNGFNTAIGVFGTNKLNVTNNVIYRPVGNGKLNIILEAVLLARIKEISTEIYCVLS